MKKKLKNKTRIVSVIMITMLTGSFAMAQPGGKQGGQQGPPPVPSDKQIEKMVKSLDKELSLSEKQGTRVSELYFAHFDKVEAKTKSSQRPARAEMETLDTDLEKEVKAVLSKDQQKEYTAWLKKQDKKKSGQGGPQGGQGPPR